MSYEYQDADRYVILHEDDPDLKPLIIPLPEPPKLEDIDGYGLPPSLQVFQHQKYPESLQLLEQRTHDNGDPFTIEDCYQYLKDNAKYYREEIEWIREQWRRRLNGYWFYCNGKPTYIDGWHYFFLNFWPVQNKRRRDGLPDYRDRDRKTFHAWRYCYKDTHCFGSTYVKHRREGATFKAECVGYCIATSGRKHHMGIQSKSEDDAKKVFRDKLVGPWKSLPFFFKPIHNGSTDPQSKIEMVPSGVRGKGGSALGRSEGIGSIISFRESGNWAYDGDKLYFTHQDEVGKKPSGVSFNVEKRWTVLKECLAQGGGSDIHGFALLTSTVEDMSGSGGEEFWNICNQSWHHKKNKNGQTNSGLYNVFIPAYEGLEGFIDEFGNSIVDDPEEPVRNDLGKMISIGARTYLQNQIDSLEEAGDHDAVNDFKRKFPRWFREAFRKASSESGFNQEILNQRLDYLRMYPKTSRYDLKWENDKRFTRVVAIPNPDHGKFLISHFFPHPFENSVIWDRELETYRPRFPWMAVAGSDPVRFVKTKSGRKSKGAGAVRYPKDDAIDSGNDPSEWVSNKFVCTYLNEITDQGEYCEDMLMMTWLYGAMHYPEVQITQVMDYFYENNCWGLFIYDVDDKGRRSPNPGTSMLQRDKQDVFQYYMRYINTFGKYENHAELLEQVKDIEGPEQMTDYDLFTAGGCCLLGEHSRIHKMQEKEEKESYETESDEYF